MLFLAGIKIISRASSVLFLADVKRILDPLPVLFLSEVKKIYGGPYCVVFGRRSKSN